MSREAKRSLQGRGGVEAGRTPSRGNQLRFYLEAEQGASEGFKLGVRRHDQICI